MNDLNGYDVEDLQPGMNACFSKTITEADIVMFAGVSGDTNAVHLNEEFAATTRIDVSGMTCLDVGQSTGGFTDCLLRHGAARVVGVDVGHGQLHPTLKCDPRVTFIEGLNARADRKDENQVRGSSDFVVPQADSRSTPPSLLSRVGIGMPRTSRAIRRGVDGATQWALAPHAPGVSGNALSRVHK